MSASKRRQRQRRALTFSTVISFAAVFAVVYFYYYAPHHQYEVIGIDVSRYQEEIDWKRVAEDDIQFAFIKATEGESLLDPYFKRNWEEAKAAGVMCGAYHFYRPSVHSDLQADQFLQHISLEDGDLPPVLDLEVTDGRSPEIIRKGVRNWMQRVERATGVRPILYTTPKYADSYLHADMEKYPLWLVHLGRGKPPVPLNWEGWDFWQYSFKGRVRGIRGDVDLDYFRGDRKALEAMAKH